MLILQVEKDIKGKIERRITTFGILLEVSPKHRFS